MEDERRAAARVVIHLVHRLEHDGGGPHVVERGLHRRVRLEQRLQDLEPAVAHLDVVVARGRVELLDDGLDRLVRVRLRVRVRVRVRPRPRPRARARVSVRGRLSC